MASEIQTEMAELEAINARLMQKNQRLSRELLGLQSVSSFRFPVEDPANPNHFYILRGTIEGIHALQRLLRQRFEDGRAVGRAESNDLVEALQASMAAAV